MTYYIVSGAKSGKIHGSLTSALAEAQLHKNTVIRSFRSRSDAVHFGSGKDSDRLDSYPDACWSLSGTNLLNTETELVKSAKDLDTYVNYTGQLTRPDGSILNFSGSTPPGISRLLIGEISAIAHLLEVEQLHHPLVVETDSDMLISLYRRHRKTPIVAEDSVGKLISNSLTAMVKNDVKLVKKGDLMSDFL